MPIYEEKNPKWYWAVLFLLPVFLAVYSPFHFGSRELHGSEGIYAAMVMEINLLVPLTVAHGELIPSSYPLFPWISSLLHICGVKMELVLRIVSIVSLAVLSGIVWQAARKALNNQAGVVAAAAMFSSIIVIEKTLDGYPDMLAIVLIFTGWMVWFMYGASRGNWDKAWIVSAFFCGLAFYTIGWTAVIYFFWPLIFMRRPLTVWPKLKKRGFAICLFILLAFILFWGIPRWIGGEDIPFRDLKLDKDIFDGYLLHILSFPFEFALRFMPWTLLAWAPFCVAFHPLDKNPIFSRFLRTIFISMFFLFWLAPFADTRELIFLIPPLAVMTGLNYWLLVRRYGMRFHRLLSPISFVLVASGGAVLAFYLLPDGWFLELFSMFHDVSFREERRLFVLGLVIGGLIIAIGLFLIFSAKLIPVWSHILLICLGFTLFFWALPHSYKAQDRSRRDFGQAFRDTLKEDFKIDKDDDLPDDFILFKEKINGLYNECFYMECQVKRIQDYHDLPEKQENVYLISTDVPIFTEREWNKLAAQQYKKTWIYLWRGSKPRENKNASKQPATVP